MGTTATVALIADTGPLLAAFDRRDRDHARCRALLEEWEEQILIPAPVLPELDYWITERLHPRVRAALLDDIISGGFRVVDLAPQDYIRVRDVCDQYPDANLGFVDAAVLAAVERLGEPKLATLDSRHFGMLRPRHVERLLLLPQ